MIIDYPLLAQIALGADRVVPTEGDGQVNFPAVLNAIVQPCSFHIISNLSSDQATSSRLTTAQATFLNQAAGTTAVLVLPKGLYQLELSLTGRANFTTAVLSNVVTVDLVYQGFTIPLAGLMLNTETGNIAINRELLLTSSATLQVSTPATNAIATNSISWLMGTSVIRRI